MLEKNVITTTPPFMTILPARDIFGTPIVNMLDLKSLLIYFSPRNLDFFGRFSGTAWKYWSQKKKILHDSSWTINVEVEIARILIRDMTTPKKTTLI